jgi:hypothetical protein
MGSPAHRTSVPVVWALQRGVSRKRSARALRLICSFFAATSVKMICSGLTPCAAATAKIKKKLCYQASSFLYQKEYIQINKRDVRDRSMLFK